MLKLMLLITEEIISFRVKTITDFFRSQLIPVRAVSHSQL